MKLYDIHCGKCETYVLTYKKEGAGKAILRLYLGQISDPPELVARLRVEHRKVNEVPNLVCPSCGEVLGVPFVSKGQRWAYRMRQGYFHRKWK